MKRCKFLCMLLVTILITCLTAPSVYGKPKTKIAISAKKITIEVGETYQLSITGAKSNVTWSSSDETAALVDNNGIVTGASEGKAKITGKYNGKRYSCQVTIKYNENVTLHYPTNDYSAVVTSWVSSASKDEEIDESDDDTTLIIPKDDLTKYDNKILKRVKAYWEPNIIEVCDDNKTYNISFSANMPIPKSWDDENMPTTLINPVSMYLIIHSYIYGYTENDITINLLDASGNVVSTLQAPDIYTIFPTYGEDE